MIAEQVQSAILVYEADDIPGRDQRDELTEEEVRKKC